MHYGAFLVRRYDLNKGIQLTLCAPYELGTHHSPLEYTFVLPAQA